MDDLKTTLTCMAYGAAMWFVLVSIVTIVWYIGFRVMEHRQSREWVRVWNEFMEFHK